MPTNSSKNDVTPNRASAAGDDSLGRQRDEFAASNAEEIDALEINLVQDADDPPDSRDGTGLIDDDLAAERIEDLTEVGPDLANKGVVSAVPGRDDTSDVLRRHHPNSSASVEDTVEASLDEPRDEAFNDGEVDEDTAA